MTNQKFSAAIREALWLAHEKKCAYTRELLDVSTLHIDHILPESLSASPSAFQEIKRDYELPKEFDLFGLENLLPCKPGANLQKGAVRLERARIHYFLGIAASKKAEIQEHLRRIEMRQSGGRALILLQRCLERGDLSVEQVAKILEQHGQQPQEIFRLVQGLRFADKTEINAVSKADIDDLWRRPLRLGANDHIRGLTFKKQSGEEVFVASCKEYEDAINADYVAPDNATLKMSVYFEHQCGLLKALRAARAPETSFVSEPPKGIVDLELIPFSFFPQIAEKTPASAPGPSYQNKVDDGTLIVKRLKQNLLRIEEPEGMGQQLIEVVRADFNGDGIEDILLFEYCYATHGTLGFGGITMITRRGPDVPFERITA